MSAWSDTPALTMAVAKVCLSWWLVTWPMPAASAARSSSMRRGLLGQSSSVVGEEELRGASSAGVRERPAL